MDDIVRQAMAKWPNVPHCHGWLALDARGNWRMRDERAQALNLPGERIANAALLGFINRNYLPDEHGRWYFQNGPQRVYVDLEATPFVVRTDPACGLVLHTGEALATLDGAWLTENGDMIVQRQDKVAIVDDRDLAACLAQLRIAGELPSDEQLLDWIGNRGHPAPLSLLYRGQAIAVSHIDRNGLAAHFGFVRQPRM